MIKSIRKVHLQPYLTEHPEMIGPMIGPKLEAFWKELAWSASKLQCDTITYRHVQSHSATTTPHIREHIRVHSTRNGLRRSSHCTTNDTEDQQGCPVWRKSTAKCPKNENSKRPEKYWSPSNGLTQWAPNQRSNTISYEEDSSWQHLLAVF